MIIHPKKVSRRRALKLATTSVTLPLVHIRTGRAAGKVSIGFWDHWVPEGNEIMKKQCAAFGAAHQVEVQPDFITSVGSKNILTIAAEAQAKTGHDVQQFPEWEVQNHADQLEPVVAHDRLIWVFALSNLPIPISIRNSMRGQDDTSYSGTQFPRASGEY